MPFSTMTWVEVDVGEHLFCLASLSGPRWASVGGAGDDCSLAAVTFGTCVFTLSTALGLGLPLSLSSTLFRFLLVIAGL